MKRVLIAVGFCLIHGLAFAQVTPNLQSGSKALLFSFAGLDNLNANSFNGGIGGKYYLSPTMAARGGIQFVSASRDIPANPGPGQTAQDGEISATTLGLNGAIEVHSGSGRVSPFLGAGIAFSTTSTENKQVNFGPSSEQRVIKNDRAGETINGNSFLAGTRFDVFGLLGAEFFIVKELSLAAEYRFGFSKISGKDEEDTQGTSSDKFKAGSASGFGITTAGVLTLSFYF
jgi:opacity protein-like surface antigen